MSYNRIMGGECVCMQTHSYRRARAHTHTFTSIFLEKKMQIIVEPNSGQGQIFLYSPTAWGNNSVGVHVGTKHTHTHTHSKRFIHKPRKQLQPSSISITLKALIPAKIICFCVFCSHPWKTSLHKLPPFSPPGTEWWWALLDLSPALALNHDVQIGLAKLRRSIQENIADCVLFRWKHEVWLSLADTEEQ